MRAQRVRAAVRSVLAAVRSQIGCLLSLNQYADFAEAGGVRARR